MAKWLNLTGEQAARISLEIDNQTRAHGARVSALKGGGAVAVEVLDGDGRTIISLVVSTDGEAT
jgi:hypothetical protein